MAATFTISPCAHLYGSLIVDADPHAPQSRHFGYASRGPDPPWSSPALVGSAYDCSWRLHPTKPRDAGKEAVTSWPLKETLEDPTARLVLDL